MKYFYGLLSSILLITFFSLNTFAQDFNGEWSCAYATIDDIANGTGYNTISVAVVGEDQFVALVRRGSNETNYLVGYSGADSVNGRLGSYAYGTSGVGEYQQIWQNGFDQTFMREAKSIAARGNLIFVANNDVNHNILVYELTEDTVMTHPMRMATFTIDSLWAIDLDDAGNVYVTTEGDSTSASKVLIYETPDTESAWSAGHSTDPLHIITLPDNGPARGIAVSPDGQLIYVSNHITGKIHCYLGNPADGYEISPAFSWELKEESIGQILGTDTLDTGPYGLHFLENNNILYAAYDVDFTSGQGYEYAKIIAINPNNGEFLDELDVAEWNYITSNSSYYRSSTTSPGNASGYASTYDIDFDANNNMYSQSYYGWTAEKWAFSGTLPTIELTITSIERDITAIPNSFNLSQNYPNPFNPSTTIEFSITERSEITLSIYSVTGELITSLINGSDLDAGVYNVTFDASLLSSGTYLYSISNGKTSISKKMILLK